MNELGFGFRTATGSRDIVNRDGLGLPKRDPWSRAQTDHIWQRKPTSAFSLNFVFSTRVEINLGFPKSP